MSEEKGEYLTSAQASLETIKRLGGHVGMEETQEAVEMLGKGYRPISVSRVMARKIAFNLINAKQVDVDALIDAIIDAAKAEIKAGL